MALMIFEYRFFKQQAEQMLRVQGEYRAYIQTVKTVVDDYTRTKERQVLLEELIKGEKKNSEIVSTAGIFHVPFPEGVRVYSSDDQELDAQDSFLVVNRELEYLKEITVAHIKEAELESLHRNIDLGEFQDYTEQLLQYKERPKRARIQKKRLLDSSSKNRQHSQIELRSSCKKDFIFSWPIDRSRFWLSSFFGPRRKKNGSPGFHYGIDMAALKGTSVMAAAPGVVIESRYNAGYGNTIVLAHNGKYKTRYAHLDSLFVKVGQPVQRGALIGTVGNTGYVRSAFGKDPSHLHFELHMFGKKVNPMHFLI